MSQLNVSRFMEKLLDGVEVEWRELGETVALQRGRRLVRSQLDESEGFAVYQNSMKPLGYYHKSNVKAGSTFVICAGAAGEIGYSEDEFWAADDVHFVVTPVVINSKYVYHFLLTQKYKILRQVRRASIPRLSKSAIDKLQIPIPCPNNPKKSLAIQAEIVRILDAFTAMTTELTTELNLRQQQYNYYRDQLLNFDEGEVEWSCLNELTSRTSNIRWQETDETYQYIDLSSVSIENNSITQTTEIDALSAPSRAQKLVQEHDVIFATTRPTQMRICLIPSDYDGAIASTGYCVLRAIQEKVLPKWIYYCLTSTCFKYFLEENQSGSAYPAISDTKLKEFSIPVPSLEEQARIVSILDKFDTLTNSITEGLPREIELRQQQYEYYRDLLFNFPKQEAVA